MSYNPLFAKFCSECSIAFDYAELTEFTIRDFPTRTDIEVYLCEDCIKKKGKPVARRFRGLIYEKNTKPG